MASTYFDAVDPKVSFPEQEEKILKFWKENNIFEKSVTSRSEDKTWTFLDGPPFITGLPHYGTLLSSIPKDLFPRYYTMKGYRVRRVWGWDCHGLPAENKVEIKLGIKRKKDIEEKVGVGKFIEECKSYVSEVSGEWDWYVDHIGRWVDIKNAYRTMDTPYMESVMWVFRQMYDKELIYKGLRVSLYCPHCSTPISNFEVAMDADNYKELKEITSTYKYELKDEKGTYLLAWSTTPWNKIVTTALAVNPKLTYALVEEEGEKLILAKSTLGSLKGKKPKVLKEFKGSELVGKKYVPHYDFYKVEAGKKAFEVIGADFVSAEEGTGIVTIAPYGEEDLELMTKEKIHVELHVDDEGNLKSHVPKWAGMNYLEVDKLVNEDLASRGLLYKEEEQTHTIPFCWRCATRLFYNPQNAWYVDVQKLKPLMKKTNERVNWFPEHFKYGRFLKSMESAPDWCISRSRYWGSPVPVWECADCGERFVPASIAELEEASGAKIKDLHKPEIDKVTVKCKKCGKDAHRVPEVLDSWIEAGSASFAERHFPFEKAELKEFFPPDFIVEYTGQIRAWFYVLHVIAAALYESHAFKNVVVTGVILGTDGRKMSKNFGNYPDPKEMIQKYGGDALRLYLLGSPVMHAEDIRISEEEYRNQVKETMLILWNVYNFFVTYANLDGWKPEKAETKDRKLSVLDRWIVSRMYGSIEAISVAYEGYDTPKVVEVAREFIVKDLSLWYVRRIRGSREASYPTLYFVLREYLKVMAPLIPFLTETIYKNLTKEESVHLSDWPEVNKELIDLKLEAEMQKVRAVIEKGHALRKEAKIPVRQALGSLSTKESAPKTPGLEDVLKEELNILDVVWGAKKDSLDTKLTPLLKSMGEAREIIRRIQEERKAKGTPLNGWVSVSLEDWPKEFEEEIKAKTRVKALKKGEFKLE
ncbi:isoleucine--tRNA ligase [Candidatus Woesebacteria bacterium]|nr:isoleucine--tRNA ligase [Candidatus Woesebacteria bacterium]